MKNEEKDLNNLDEKENEKQEEDKKQEENENQTSKTNKTKGSKERMFTAEEVQAMLKQVAESNKIISESEEKEERKKVRLTTIEGNLVVGFKNRNQDEFLPGVVIHAFNRWDDNAKQNIAWVEAVFENGKTKEMPLLYLVSNGKPVVCDIVKESVNDESFSLGKIEQKIYDESGGSMKGNGLLVDQKIKKFSRDFTVLLPNGKEIIVPEYVVNMV